MKLPEASSGSFEKAPAGNHAARCYEVIDMGTQERKPYQGEPRLPVRQLWVGWELVNEEMDDGRPFVIGRRYNLSMNENSALRKDLESWRGKPFDDAKDLGQKGSFSIEKLLDAPCFLNVTHSENNDRTYANVDAVTPVPKGTEVPKLTNSTVFVCLDPDEFSEEAFGELSERMQGIVSQSPEFQKLGTSVVPKADSGTDEGDGSPF